MELSTVSSKWILRCGRQFSLQLFYCGCTKWSLDESSTPPPQLSKHLQLWSFVTDAREQWSRPSPQCCMPQRRISIFVGGSDPILDVSEDATDQAYMCNKYAKWLDPEFCPLFTIKANIPASADDSLVEWKIVCGDPMLTDLRDMSWVNWWPQWYTPTKWRWTMILARLHRQICLLRFLYCWSGFPTGDF